MPSAVKWEAAWTSRGNVLTTQLNSLGAGSTSAVGAEIDNSVNLDTYGKLEVNVTFGSAPTAGTELTVYMVTAPDGTNYHDSNVNVIPPKAIAFLPVTNGTGAQILMSGVFNLEPAKTKFLLKNGTNQAFPASGSTVELFTDNLELQ